MHHPMFQAQKTPDKPAYIIAETGEALSFSQLDARSNQGAQLFYALGLKAGDHVAFLLENGLPLVEIAWAAQRAGLIFTAISRYLKADEIAYIVVDCGAKVFVTSPVCIAQTRGLSSEAHLFIVGGREPGFRDWTQEVAGQPTTPVANE